MYITCVKFIGAFPDGDKIVEICSPNGGGGGNYHLMIGNLYWGIIGKFLGGWKVRLQNENSDYTAGDLQPLLELILPEKQFE